jgi:malonate decarboxylase epsilon subunit
MLPFRPHDLLFLRLPDRFDAGGAWPDWLDIAWLMRAPLVVRRDVAPGSLVPVGARGTARNQRCKGQVQRAAVTRCVTPESLAHAPLPSADTLPALPALHTLALLAPRLAALGLAWGPTGGAGFQLASGLPVLRPDSDLDLVVRAPTPLSAHDTRQRRDRATMTVLFTFPGQGAQQAGMLQALAPHGETARTLDEAAAVLACDPYTLDTAAALRSTVAVQLCLVIAGVATARHLAALGALPSMVAGLSIGAYPAAVTAGVLDFGDALRLVAQRATSMENAYPSGYGMTAVTGLTAAELQPLVAQVHGTAAPVYLANLNGPRQLVIAGADDAMAAVAALVHAGGSGAKAERLAVGVPSHCELFATQADALAAAMAAVPLHRPRIVYLSGSVARALFDGAAIGRDLAYNMARQVQWYDTVRHAWERGARLAVEMPTGSVLTKLTQPVFGDGMAVSCAGTRLEDIARLVARHAGGT